MRDTKAIEAHYKKLESESIKSCEDGKASAKRTKDKQLKITSNWLERRKIELDCVLCCAIVDANESDRRKAFKKNQSAKED